MTLLDDRGRLFGRLNIIDAMVLAVVGLLVPLTYGAYMLFRTPAPRVVRIEPNRLPYGGGEITVRGEYLYPSLRFTIGTHATRFLFETPDAGLLRLSSIPPGSYDIVVYDGSQEVARLRDGLRIDPSALWDASPHVEVEAIGKFYGLNEADAHRLVQDIHALGQQPTEWGYISGFQPVEPNIEYIKPDIAIADRTYQVRAVLRFRCRMEPYACKVGDVTIEPMALVPITIGRTTTYFRMDEVHPVYTGAVNLTVRANLAREVVDLIKAGQPDGSRFPALEALRPSIVAMNVAGAGGSGIVAANVQFRVPAISTPDGWRYGTRMLRVGDPFEFQAPLYVVHGTIVRIVAGDGGGTH